MKTNIRKSFLFNLGIILILCLLLYIAFFATLNCITRHGLEVPIPDVRGKDLSTAIALLKEHNFEVSIDSVYEPDSKAMSVLKQVPDSGSIVKEGRIIFLTINRVVPPQIPMPDLVNLSFRSAEMMLKNNKLKLGDTSFKPSLAAGLILEQSWNGQPVKAGDIIPQGSKISLVIGDGMGKNTFSVPDVIGMNAEDAELTINQNNLQYNLVLADPSSVISDTSTATVVNQDPLPTNEAGVHNTIKAGSVIKLMIK